MRAQRAAVPGSQGAEGKRPGRPWCCGAARIAAGPIDLRSAGWARTSRAPANSYLAGAHPHPRPAVGVPFRDTPQWWRFDQASGASGGARVWTSRCPDRVPESGASADDARSCVASSYGRTVSTDRQRSLAPGLSRQTVSTDPKRSPGSRRSRQNGVEASQVRLQQARWGSTESADEHRRREAGADATQADPSRPGAGTTVTLNCSMRDQAKPQRSYAASFLTVARRPNGRLTACHPDTPSETRKVRRTSAHPLRISASLQYKFTYALPQGRAGRMAIEVPTGGAIRRTRGDEASGLASRPAFAVRFAADERGPANSYLAGPHPFCRPSLDSR